MFASDFAVLIFKHWVSLLLVSTLINVQRTYFCFMFEYLLLLVCFIGAQIEILLGKTENFDELMAAAAEERDVVDGEEQS